MRIVFFGSSHGVPEPNRKSSSAMIEVGERRYFVDMGTQSIEGLIDRNIPIESVKGIFITHMHGDHSNGMISFLDLCSWYFKNSDFDIFVPEDKNIVIAGIKGWFKCTGSELRDFRFHEVSEGEIWDDGVLKVTAFKTMHTDKSYAFLLEAEGKRVLFSGDLKQEEPQKDFLVGVFEKPLDLAVCEGAHFPVTKYLPIFEGKTNVKQICINHYTETRVASALEFKEKMRDVAVFLATDGMEFNL